MSLYKRTSVIFLIITILSGCTSLPKEIEHPIEPSAIKQTSALSKLVENFQPEQLKHEKTAVLLQDSGWDALAQRLALIETAEHSIDIQYYIWNTDTSGKYLAKRLMAAADRGVKVRVMLDDINLNKREDILAELDRHSHIEIRIYNPIPSRHGLVKWLNVLSDFSRLNRRMHNKSFTVDGVMSIVGGRNIGDEYFDLSDDINFRDRDVLVMGQVVTNIQTSFIQYWNSRWSYPVRLLTDNISSDLSAFDSVVAPRYKNYPVLPEGNAIANNYLSGLMDEITWVKAHFISDRPVPVDTDITSEPKATAKLLAKLAKQSRHRILFESAYLIFDDRQLKSFLELTQNGLQIKALTNSMASNDLVTNHSGYAGRRYDMLDNGIQLFELKPETNLCKQSTKDLSKCAPTTAYGLHAKTAVFDSQVAVIGSFNFNLRSTYLNTESLLVIENQSVAEKLADDIEQAMNIDNSWRLSLDEGNIYWNSDQKKWDTEPKTGLSERIKSRLLQLLPIEKYL
jgi:putative cardiolipin synthase